MNPYVNMEFCGCARPDCPDCGSYRCKTWSEWHNLQLANGDTPYDCHCALCLREDPDPSDPYYGSLITGCWCPEGHCTCDQDAFHANENY